jgi:tetratricopeptide (TPR) repeat protein
MTKRPANPYIAGTPLRGHGGFFGRQDILEWVTRELRNPATNALVLSGQRRIGKTSLLLQLSRYLPTEDYFSIYFDLQNQSNKPLGRVLADLADKVAEQAGLDAPEPETFDDQGRFFQKRFIPRLHQALHEECRPVFLLDEFDVMDQGVQTELEETVAAKALFPFLRDLMEDPRLAFIFVVGRQVDDLSLDFAATFKTSLKREVWLLDVESTEKLIRQAETNGTLHFDDAAIQCIFDLTNGHPYLTQLLCQRIWQRAYTNDPTIKPSIQARDVESAISETLEVGEPALTWLWNGLGPAEKIYAAALAEISKDDKPIPEDHVMQVITDNAKRLRTRDVEREAPHNLVKRNVLELLGARQYRFAVPLFQLWVKNYKPLSDVKDEIDQIEPVAHRLFLFGKDFFDRRKYDVAIRFFHDALEQNDVHFKARLYLGEALLALGKVGEAVEELELAYQADNAEARSTLIRALLDQARSRDDAGDDKGALESIEKILAISPRDQEAYKVKNAIWNRRGDVAIKNNDLSYAEIAFRQAQNTEKLLRVHQMRRALEEVGSWEDIDERLQVEVFVGRAEELKMFQENFVSKIPKYMVLSITGEGGVGKSFLLKRFEELAMGTGINANVVRCDSVNLSPISVMGHIAEQLSRLGIEERSFDERYIKYRELRTQIESDPDVPRGVLEMISRGLTDVTIRAIGRVPGLSQFSEVVDEKAVSDTLYEMTQYTLMRFSNKDEIRLVREPENILTPLFVALLNKATEKKRLILMFDSFELTQNILSPWLLSLFTFEYGNLNVRLTFVISGRDPLDQHWTQLGRRLLRLVLEPFELKETREYLVNRGITDEALIERIHHDTAGLPVLVELLAATNPRSGVALPDISKDAVDRFLQWTSPDKRKIALLAAVPRGLNQDILSALLASDGAAMFNWLTSQSYVRSNSERGWYYHSIIRRLLLRYLRNASPAELTQANMRLAAYFKELQDQSNFKMNEAHDSESWWKWEVERIYHQLKATPDQAVALLTNGFLHSLRYRYRFAGELAHTGEQAGSEGNDEMLVRQANLLSKCFLTLDKNDNEDFISLLNVIEKSTILDSISEATICGYRGNALRMLGEYEEALTDFSCAIGLDEKYTWAIINRGETYQQMGKYDEALADFDRAIELDEKYARAIASRGEIYRLMGKYPEALADFDRAIELDEKYAGAIASRGKTYQLLCEFDKALADIELSIALEPENSRWIWYRGTIHRDMKRYLEALKDLNQARDIDPSNKVVLYSLGETHRRMGEFDLALEEFKKYLETEKADIATLVSRAWVYKQLHDTSSLDRDIEFALSLECKDEGDHYYRGVAFILNGNVDDALIDFDISFTDLSCRARVAYDDLLDPIREMPEFQALLDKYH